jgi:choice-of-anchor A domain-containing protein
MISQISRSVLSVSIASFFLGAAAQAQVVQRVNVMPGYPNAPRTSIDQRRLVRPGVHLILWGSANDGDSTANAMDYTWVVTPGADVAFTDDGSLSDSILDDYYISEEVTFTLLNGATNGLAEATLTVTDGVNTFSDTVEIAIIDSSDVLSDTELEDQQIDVNIAIDEGLRALYQSQSSSGSWSGSTTGIGPTGFSLWAMQNQGHLATNDSDEDILSERVQLGLDYLFNNCQIVSDVDAPNADVARGATANGKSDMNSNGQAISFGPTSLLGGPSSKWGYEHPIATAALAASISPTEVVGVGPAAGMTYAELGEDCMDMIGVGQVENSSWRGGWRYMPNEFSSDMSVNSWHYVAMEGLYVTFGLDIPDWILQESEMNLVFHQANMPGAVPFGYDDPNRLISYEDGHSTTGGGLSGLYAAELQGPHTSGGAITSLEPAPLNSITAKRDAALEYLGDYWGEENPGAFAEGNRGNSYAMWTVARALRLTAFALSLPSGEVVQLENMGTSFDWETGEENSSGVLAAPGSDREGYFSYLVRTQDALNGGWNLFWGQDLDTAMAVLILTPKVFLIEPPDDGGGDDGDLSHGVLGALDVDIRTSHIYGTVAAGNDLFVETSNLALAVSPEETDSMIADRDIHAQLGLLDHGNVVAGNSLNIAPTFGIAGGTLEPRIEDVIDFDALFDYISSMTTTMGALAPTGTVVVSQDNLIMSAHNGAATEIFLVTAAQLEAARDVTIDVDAGSAVLVNIEGGNLNPIQFGIRLHNVSADMVLFNAFEASEIYIADVNFDGSLIAQTGEVEIAEIDVAGQLIAGGDITLQTTRVFGEIFSGDLEDFLPFMGGLSVQVPSDVLLHNLVITPGETGTVRVTQSESTEGSPLVVTVNGLTRHFRSEKIERLTLAGVQDAANVNVDSNLNLDVHYLEQQPLGGQDVFMLDQFDVPETGRGMIHMDLFSNDLAGSSGLNIGSFQVVKRPEHAVVRFDAESGRVRYLWDASKWSSDSFEYTVLDGNGVRSAPVEVRILR